MPRGRRASSARSGAATARSGSPSPRRGGRARSRGDLGERRADRSRRARRSRDPRGRPGRDRDHEPARDDGRLGAGRPRDRCIRRSCGRTGGRPSGDVGCPWSSCAGGPGSFPIRTSRPRSSSGSSSAPALPQAELAFGTIDSWLVWKLTGGEAHITDVDECVADDAPRPRVGRWDDELVALFGVDPARAPDVVASSRCRRPRRRCSARRVPVAGIAGDQQAALFGQGCYAPGEAKATYGTGTFVLVALGDEPGRAVDGLLTTAAAVEPAPRRRYAARGLGPRRRRGAAVAPRRARRDRVGRRERAAWQRAWTRRAASTSCRRSRARVAAVAARRARPRSRG